jgi:hypothetical protein
MQAPRYRTRFTLYRYAGAILVCCDRCRQLVSICLDPADVPWEAAAHLAARGEG